MWNINRIGVVAFFTILTIAMGGATTTPGGPPEAPPISLTVKVVDEAGAPIASAPLQISTYSQGKSEAVANDKGEHVITFTPQREDYLLVFVDAPGRVPMRQSYYGGNSRGPVIPAECIIALPKATTIGGTVVDDAGKPVAGAAIKLGLYDKRDDENNRPTVFIQDVQLTTDAQGRWSFDRAPAVVEIIYAELKAPGFVNTRESHQAFKSNQTEPSTQIPKLHDQSAVFTFPHGERVHGRVLGNEGRPVAEAKISVAPDAYNMFQEVATTDIEGRWSFQSKPGPVFVLAQAKGLAPVEKSTEANPDLPPLEFALKPAWTLHGRVVDPSGKPIEKVGVAIEKWNNRRYGLNAFFKTDPDGRFEIAEAPDEPFELEAYGSGHMRVTRIPVQKTDEELTITMPFALRLSGMVTDAKSGKPLDEFTVVPMWSDKWSGDRMQENRQDAGAFSNTEGWYEVSISYPRDGHGILVEAPGHKPFLSGTYANDAGPQELDVSLEPAEQLVTRVVTPKGEPIPGASVHVVSQSSRLQLQDGEPFASSNRALKTDAKGELPVPAQNGPFGLVVLADDGYGFVDEASLRDGQPLVKHPWCRIEGTYLRHGQPWPDQSLGLQRFFDPMDAASFAHPVGDSAKTDAEGHFTFERVPSGLISVVHYLPIGEHTSVHGRAAAVDLKPGQTANIVIGGIAGGRVNVIGKAALPDQLPRPISFEKARCAIYDGTEPPRPDDWEQLTAREKQAREQEWKNSAIGREWQRARFIESRNVTTFLDADGTFRLDGVMPGRYRMKIDVFDAADVGSTYGNEVATLEQEITIAESPSGKPVDLGDLPLDILTMVAVGDEAPDFEVKTLDGKPLKLSDHRGKVVLLDFWATWCGPCMAQVPDLIALRKQFADRDDFVIIGLSLDEKAETAAKVVSQKEMAWIHGHLGKWSDDSVTNQYGVKGIPATFLIDRDGNVIAKNLHGPETAKKVTAALEPQ